jgi:hypothetical protein
MSPTDSSNRRKGRSSRANSNRSKGLSPAVKAIGAATAGAIACGLVVTAIARAQKPTISKTAEKVKDWMKSKNRKNRVKAVATSPPVKTLLKGIAKSASQALEEVA